MRKSIKKLMISSISIFSLIVIISVCYVGNTIKEERDFENSILENGFTDTISSMFPLTNEELDNYVTPSSLEKIEALPSYSKDDTWDIYIYMCGSDLESFFRDTLSDTSNFDLSIINASTNPYKEMEIYNNLKTVLYENNMDFPLSFYDPLPSTSGSSSSSSSGEDYSDEAKGSASEDLRSITTTPLNDKVRFIIQTGGSKKWDYPGVNPNRTQRFIYDVNGFYEVYNGPLENMGSEDTLKNFLSFINSYDSTHKAFIFWNHGEGSFGAEYDEIFNDKLYLSEMRNAFNGVYDLKSGNPPFELIGFDACLMGSSEALYYLKDVAKYYVGSEDIEFGGWNYKEWITSLCNDTSMNGAMLASHIVDSFMKLSTQQYLIYEDEEVPNTLSVFDLQKGGKIYEEYSNLMEMIMKDLGKNPYLLSVLTNASLSSIRYASSDFENFNTCDLSIFLENLKPLYEKEVNSILSLIERSVLYTRGRGHNNYSNGVSVYYPSTIKDLPSLLKAIDYIDNVSINKALSSLYYYKAVGCLDLEKKLYLEDKGYDIPVPLDSRELHSLNNAEVTFNSDDSFSVKIPDNLIPFINSIRLITASYEDEKVTYLHELPVTFNDNIVTAPIVTNSIFLKDEELSLEFMDKTNDIIRYKSPILINGNESSIIISQKLNDNSLSLSGIKDISLPSDTFTRAIKHLKKGDKLTPLYYTESGFYLNGEYTEGESVKYNKDKELLSIQNEKDGQYLFTLEVMDLRGDVYTTPIVSCEIEKGKVKTAYVNSSFTPF